MWFLNILSNQESIQLNTPVRIVEDNLPWHVQDSKLQENSGPAGYILRAEGAAPPWLQLINENTQYWIEDEQVDAHILDYLPEFGLVHLQ